jgi:hypothetical protein
VSRHRRTTTLRGLSVLALLAAMAPAAAGAQTRTVAYGPFAADGALRRGLSATAAFGGTCDTGSFVVAGADVFRCFSATTIHDPCYRDAGQSTPERAVVVCVADPWTSAAVRLRVTEPPHPDHGAEPGGLPWALTLASGRRCRVVRGATPTVGGRRLHYVCGGGRVLFGSPDRTTATWRIRQATDAGGRDLRKVAIATAWR